MRPDITFDLGLAIARVFRAVVLSLPVSGAGGAAMGDWSVTAWAAGAAALSAAVVDLDAFIKAREARRLAWLDQREAVAEAKAEVRAESPQEVTIKGPVEVKGEGE